VELVSVTGLNGNTEVSEPHSLLLLRAEDPEVAQLGLGDGGL
jgi:hypothetical protein